MKKENRSVSAEISRYIYIVLLVCCLLVCSNLHAATVTIYVDDKSPQTLFASQEIQEALKTKGYEVRRSNLRPLEKTESIINIVLLESSQGNVVGDLKRALDSKTLENLKSEGYYIGVSKNAKRTTYMAVGTDAAGVMYGGLELAEIIKTDGLNGIKETMQNPYMSMRGTKFNVPLDVRTPSYSDTGESAQENMAQMWEFDFWKEYIDNLARYRYNFISLWSLHPFPSLVKVPDYPDIALEDVKRSTVTWKENYNLMGLDTTDPDIVNNVETLKKITIEEKITFWRKVMRYAKGRNVDIYFVTWNIFVNGTDGKYGITDDIDNQTTTDYFRKSIRQMFLTYPDLKGIGLTTGENMPGVSSKQREDWAFKTYGQGMLDAAREMPGRKFVFLHRQHQSDAQPITDRFAPLIKHKDIEFIFSFKYAKAHVFSSIIQHYHHGFVREIGDLKTIWTLRNDDIYYFRWGGPDFVREFIKNIPYDVSKGYYYGSDGYIWGREFLSTEPEIPRQIEIVKHWYHWMIWGRLGYNPNLGNERFVKIIQQRYPQISAPDLFAAWQEASMIYPTTTGFHWGPLDFQWYIEACKSQPGPAKTESGFHDVNRFISLPPHNGTGYVSIPDYVNSLDQGKELAGTTPIEVSNQIHRHSDKALQILEGISDGGDKELRLTLQDIRTIAYLGKYYAHKICGATELALFRKNQKKAHQNAAIDELTKAVGYWRLYASMGLGQYKNPLWTNRVGYVDWRKLYAEVLKDIEIAGGKVNPPSIEPTPGGTILKAPEGSTSWTYDAPKAGIYILEIQYSLRKGQYPAILYVNEKSVGEIVLWMTGSISTFCWDRKTVELKKGKNTICLTPQGDVFIKHLNVIGCNN